MNEEINYEELEGKLDYSFNNKLLLKQACTHESYLYIDSLCESNKVLVEWGARVLRFYDMLKWKSRKSKHFSSNGYLILPNEIIDDFIPLENNMSYFKHKLKDFFYFYDIEKYVLLDHRIVTDPNEIKDIYENIAIAIIGAVFFDSYYDLSKVYKIISKFLQTMEFDDNYINILNASISKLNIASPIYLKPILRCVFSNGEEEYKCEVEVNGKKYFGIGNSIFNARIAVSKKAYKELYPEILKSIVGEPDRDTAIAQLEELYQQDYIEQPVYSTEEHLFSDDYDSDDWGWIFSCFIYENEFCDEVTLFIADREMESGQKEIAYRTLCKLLNHPYIPKYKDTLE